MAAVTLDPTLKLRAGHRDGVVVVEEIPGLIRVYRDGQVERPQIVPLVSSFVAPELGVTSRDVTIDKLTNIWARFYVPKCNNLNNLPLVVYFHGGGFCVGSAAWSCYHDFLARLAAKAGCVIMSVNYRLSPEHKLPSAYEDGFKSLMWLRQQVGGEHHWWSSRCDYGRVFLAGDSAGANIAYNIAARLGSNSGVSVKGVILIQPFFGGEARTNSEKYTVQPPRSALSLAASDAYWRLALPAGVGRDHPWCNPMSRKGSVAAEVRMLVCVSEMDILRDRNLEFSAAMRREGKRVEHVVYKGVGHAFQVLSKSQQAQALTLEMMAHIKVFVNGPS